MKRTRLALTSWLTVVAIGCTAEVGAVETSEQALFGNSLPSRLSVSDEISTGAFETVYTRHGLVFSVNAEPHRATGRIQNHGNRSVVFLMNVLPNCPPPPMTGREFQVSLSPGDEFAGVAACVGGTAATKAVVQFEHFGGQVFDIGYHRTSATLPPHVELSDRDFDGVPTLLFASSASSAGELKLSAHLRETRAEVHLVNQTHGAVPFHSFVAGVSCDDGSGTQTATPPSQVLALGQDLHLEARCRTGRAARAYAVFWRRPPR
jgi:hypothetical protein